MLITCVECGKKVSDTAKTCPHCGAPVKLSKRKTFNVTLIIEFKGGIPMRKTDRFHVLIDGYPVGLASYNEPFTFTIRQTVTLAIKLKDFMQYRSEPALIEWGKDVKVRFSVSFVTPAFRSPKAIYKLEEIK